MEGFVNERNSRRGGRCVDSFFVQSTAFMKHVNARLFSSPACQRRQKSVHIDVDLLSLEVHKNLSICCPCADKSTNASELKQSTQSSEDTVINSSHSSDCTDPTTPTFVKGKLLCLYVQFESKKVRSIVIYANFVIIEKSTQSEEVLLPKSIHSLLESYGDIDDAFIEPLVLHEVYSPLYLNNLFLITTFLFNY